MATELATGVVTLYGNTANLARDAARSMDLIATDMQRTFSRAFDRVGTDMRGALGQAGGQAGDDAAREMQQRFAGGFNNIGNDMRRELSRSAGQAADDAAEELRRGLHRGSEAAGDDLRRQLSRAGQDAGQEGGAAAGGGILDSLKGKAGAIGEVLTTAIAVVGVTAGGLFVKGLLGGMEREQTLDLTQARLGIDDAAMHKIGVAAGLSYGDAFGTSVEENIDTARRAIQSGLLDPNATAQETQQVISSLSGISDLMGEEIPAVARAAGQAIRTGIAGNAAEAFDLFAAAERNGLNVSEDFLDTITEYGTQFRKLGLSGPEAVGLISQAVKSGARDTDIAADAFKEFAIRAVDGSESTAEAFKKLGLPVEQTMGAILNGGSEAHDAMTALFHALNKINDPIKANEIALALFGTQVEDLGDAFLNMNVDTAVSDLGRVAGAANEAFATMGGNAATSIESAKRSITTTTDAISAALANAFGPALASLADWVSEHQPQILDFLGAMVDGLFVAADAFLAFSAVSLRALADFAEGAGQALSAALGPLGMVASIFGKLTFNQSLEDAGNALQTLDTKFQEAADGARALAEGIDNTARPGLAGLRDTIGTTIDEAVLSAEVFQALGDTVQALPSEHDIYISENTPEVAERLAALGLQLQEMPDGTFRVIATTDEAQQRVDAFIVANTGKRIPLTGYVSFETSVPVSALAATHDIPPGRAGGGVFRGQGGPTSDANLIRISDREHLAYITQAQAVNPATLPFLEAINAGWVPPAALLHGMIPGFAGGGLVPGKAFAQSMDPVKYQMGGFSTSSIDCSGMVSATINDALGLPPFSSRMATASEGPWLAAKGAVGGLGAGGDISVGWVNGGPGGGHTAMTLSDGTNVESNGSDGVVVGGPVGAADPMFTQKMHIPAALLRGGDLGGSTEGTFGSGTGGTGVGGMNGDGTGAGGVGGAGGGTFGGTTIPQGVTPVWIVGSNAGGAKASGDGTTPASPESFAPQSSGSKVQTVEEVLASIPGRAASAGQGFIDANVNQLVGDLGGRTSGGAVQELVKVIQSNMAAEIARVLQQSRAQATSFIGRR